MQGVRSINVPKFIVDANVGRLVKWLRMIGYDTLFFNRGNDSDMVATALAEERVILTRDTQIAKRRAATSGRLKIILIQSDDPQRQMQQVISTLDLNCRFRPFTICLECNQPLLERSKQQVKDLVPPYVFKTQNQYMECPACHRIYWRGTHWQAMTRKLEQYMEV